MGSVDFSVSSAAVAASSSCIVGDITFAANTAIVQIWDQPSSVEAS